MFRNYLKTAWRNFRKHKTFSFINVVGLTAGTMCCIFILLYIKEQYGYDTYHKEAESIYRVRTIIKDNSGKDFISATTSPPIAFAMKRDFPEVQVATRVLYLPNTGKNLLSQPGSDEAFFEQKGYMADSTFFDVFTYKFTEGTPLHALKEPYTVVLSSAIAQKLFGHGAALNKQIKIENRFGSSLYKITGVYDETFGKSHMQPGFIMNMNSGGIGEIVRTNNQWAGQNFVHTYIKLHPDANANALQARLPAFLQKYGADNLRELGFQKTLLLQPVTDIHLHSKGIEYQLEKNSDSGFLNILLSIAVFIQLIACINFINLTTARSLQRARETGIRKVVGAVQSSLIKQFLSESVLVSMAATLLAVPLVILALPFLNSLTGGNITLNALQQTDTILLILGLGLITGLLAGIYPALYLAGFKPIQVLKGPLKFKAPSLVLRKGLVVFQFVIAVVLISSVIIISQQLKYMQSQDTGFDQQQKLVISFQSGLSQQAFQRFKHEIAGWSTIRATGGCNNYPSRFVMPDVEVFPKGQNRAQAKQVRINRADEDFFEVLNIRLIAGRNLRPSDTLQQNVVMNETAIQSLGFTTNNAIGERVQSEYEGKITEYTIVGVIRDYNYNSLREPVQSMMTVYTRTPSYMVLSYNNTGTAELLATLETTWKKMVPAQPFEYAFLDEEMEKLYAEEQTAKRISNSFTTLAILISCLGLFGLALFTAQQRVKEIGVRKVLGASAYSITALLTKDILKPVFIAILIASPVAWWLMQQWLKDFTYRITINWWVFGWAGGIAILVATTTICFQAIKAAIRNPVKSLRTE